MGLLVSKYGIGPTEEKVRAVLESSRPTTPTEVRSFLGMVGFSACFIPNFATIAEPLRGISRQETPFVWGSEQEASFQELKLQLASAPVLAYFDKEAHTRVIADASPVGLGAVLPMYLQVELERVQRRALSCIFPRVHYSDALQLAGLESIRAHQEKLTEHLFKSIVNDPRSKITSLLPPAVSISHELRRQRRFATPLVKTNRFANSFIVKSARKAFK